jgi:hypothetical protein
VTTSDTAFGYSFDVFPFIATRDEYHLDSKAVSMGAAGLLEGNFPERSFRGEGFALRDMILDETLHLFASLLSEPHVQRHVSGLRLIAELAFAGRVPQQRRGTNICTEGVDPHMCDRKNGRLTAARRSRDDNHARHGHG